MNKKIIAAAIFFFLMSLGQLLEGGLLSFLLLFSSALLIAQLDKELKSRVLNKINKPELSLPDIEKPLSIKLVAALFFTALIFSPSGELDTGDRLSDELSTSTKSDSQQWYEGGDLHQVNALAWQNAESRNKLATCADLVFAMKDSGLLKDEITQKLNSIQDYKSYAYQLRTALDAAFKKERDPELNEKLFTNQEVHTTAAMLAATMGWTN